MSIETGSWRTIRNEQPLPDDVRSSITLTMMEDGTIEFHMRSLDGQSLDDMVADIERARDRLNDQLAQRFTRCPLFSAANDKAAA